MLRLRSKKVCVSITIGSNISSLQTQRALEQSTNRLSAVFERLASGQRINRASDDAAGLAVAESLNTNARVFNQALRNLNDGISALSIADQSIGTLTRIVERQRELAFQSANGIFTDTQRASLDAEAQALAEEYQRIVDSTEFNGQNLLNGSSSHINLQAGFGDDAVLRSDILGTGAGTVQQLLEQTIGSIGDAGQLTSMEFYVHDFNDDGIDDLFFVGHEALGGTSVDYAIGTMIGSEDGTYTIPAIRTGAITADVGVINAFSVRVDTAGEEIGVSAADAGFNLKSYDWGWNANGRIDPFSAPDSGSFYVENTISDGSVVADFNNDGLNDAITADVAGNSFLVSTLADVEVGAGVTTSLTQGSFSLATVNEALSAIDSLDSLATILGNTRATIGASQSRINAALNVIGASEENYRAAESRIRDADIATETASLVRLNILQQASAAVLSQANLQPQLALSLLRTV